MIKLYYVICTLQPQNIYDHKKCDKDVFRDPNDWEFSLNLKYRTAFYPSTRWFYHLTEIIISIEGNGDIPSTMSGIVRETERVLNVLGTKYAFLVCIVYSVFVEIKKMKECERLSNASL